MMVILNICQNILWFFFFIKGVERGRMIGFGTKDAFFWVIIIIIIIKAMWYRVTADVMCFHHNGISLMFRA